MHAWDQRHVWFKGKLVPIFLYYSTSVTKETFIEVRKFLCVEYCSLLVSELCMVEKVAECMVTVAHNFPFLHFSVYLFTCAFTNNGYFPYDLVAVGYWHKEPIWRDILHRQNILIKGARLLGSLWIALEPGKHCWRLRKKKQKPGCKSKLLLKLKTTSTQFTSSKHVSLLCQIHGSQKGWPGIIFFFLYIMQKM